MKNEISKTELTFGQALSAVVRKEAGVKKAVGSLQSILNGLVNSNAHGEVVTAYHDIESRIQDIKDIPTKERKISQKTQLKQAQQERAKLYTMLGRVTDTDGEKTPKQIEESETGYVITDKEVKSEEETLRQMLKTALTYANKHGLDFGAAVESVTSGD
jgi:hypothetical protein